MLKEEFKNLTGINEISDEEYKRLEVIYEELPDISKEEFCAMYKNLDFSCILKWAVDLAISKRYAEIDRDKWEKSANTIATDVVLEHNDLSKGDAYDILGTSKAIKVKILNRKPSLLDEQDLKYICNNID